MHKKLFKVVARAWIVPETRFSMQESTDFSTDPVEDFEPSTDLYLEQRLGSPSARFSAGVRSPSPVAR